MIRSNTLYKALPQEYQQVEFIRTNSNEQYINTGFKPLGALNLIYTADIALTTTEASSAEIIFGSNIDGHLYYLLRTDGKVTLRIGEGYNNTITADTNRHTVILDTGLLKAYYDGQIYTSSTGNSFTIPLLGSNDWIGIGGGQNGSKNNVTKAPCRIYSFIISQYYTKEETVGNLTYTVIDTSRDPEIIHHYIPCYRKSDSRCGVYDIVAEAFIATSNISSGDTYIGDLVFPEVYESRNGGCTYIGNNNIARKVQSVYIGVNNVARKIKKIYAGDANDIARLVYYAPVLPSAYQQVEYIESTGTQYINTGVSVSTTTAMTVDYQLTDITATSSDNFIAGHFTESGKRFYIKSNSTEIGMDVGMGTGYTSWVDTSLNRKIVTADLNNLKCYIDGESIIRKSSSAFSKISTGQIWLFGAQNRSYAKVKIYHAIIGVMNSSAIYTSKTRDMYPCYRKSDDVIGMYDIVNDVFYTNAGSGIFTAGPKYVKEL